MIRLDHNTHGTVIRLGCAPSLLNPFCLLSTCHNIRPIKAKPKRRAVQTLHSACYTYTYRHTQTYMNIFIQTDTNIQSNTDNNTQIHPDTHRYGQMYTLQHKDTHRSTPKPQCQWKSITYTWSVPGWLIGDAP